MSAQRILVVDDEVHIRRLLQGTLKRAGYDVVEAVNATEALEQARRAKPDAMLLDLGLPDRDGLEIIQLLKAATPAPIIVVSAREATEQKVAALDLGAHDYVTKPFDSEEVLARLRASLRERVAAQGAAPLIHSGAVQIDLASRRITRDGEEVHLTRKEFDVLTQMALHPGRVVTHQRILEAAWPHDHDRRIDYLRIVVRNLRQKLEADPARPSMIVNELGIGYRLMAD
ncbi:two component transcriptional regulator, winged helix family [Sphingobium chlorophenolicum L-1]|uniref:Two component transcriptional regulator, winged helix family n=1 Tax=Sphingobium chlorophenolicum L-1 TaxID=690566 RepID=F6EU90_SPHCR|nr:response regulator transcription factor [Sphingobium chlorophenolicum]AEG48719.1 two component transcriptional regulator, winged helix family [Sphingobium chlorophenolicum L-1]